MRKLAKLSFVLSLIVPCVTIGRIVYGPNLSGVTFDRVRLVAVIATLIVILMAWVTVLGVAADSRGGGQVAAIFALFFGACTFVGFAFELWSILLDERGALIGPAALIFLGLPSLAISSLFAWRLSSGGTPDGESTSHAASGA